MSAAGITASTALFGVIGNPVRHSLSPAMQTAAFAAAGIDAVYVALEVERERIAEALGGAFALGFGGVNVTVPFKRAAFEFCSERDETALSTGAANTLVRAKSGWRAYNTDVEGFIGAVGRDLGFAPKGRRALVVGAGGAARAALAGLTGAGGAGVFIAARDLRAAASLAGEFSGHGARVEPLSFAQAPDVLSPGDLLVSATPLGLDPSGVWPVDLNRFDPGVLVYDMAYSPGVTSLEAQAAGAGLRAAGGRTMLALQGAAAFRLWTGIEPPVEVMLKALTA